MANTTAVVLQWVEVHKRGRSNHERSTESQQVCERDETRMYHRFDADFFAVWCIQPVLFDDSSCAPVVTRCAMTHRQRFFYSRKISIKMRWNLARF